MIETGKREARSHMVVVVGVDLSDVSEHVLARARDLVRSIDDAELHVVHVVEPQPLRHLFESLRPANTGARSDPEPALRELQGFCESSLPGSRERVVLHTPVGRPADELARIALKTAADIIVVEVHEHPPRVFHHALVARLARIAPCSVLAIRDPGRKGQKWTSSESGIAMTP
jgi:nucleotide-binding universal stress UspA family protein